MEKQMLGILHPGAMGTSVAASAQNSGNSVYWASKGRSQQTQEKATGYGLVDAHTIRELCEICSIIVCVCPPDAAESVALQVLDCGFAGLYLDANAISPQRVTRIDRAMQKAGVTFVDGGIIGGPAWEPAKTFLYLSGEDAQRAADCFSAGPLETCIIGDTIGKASSIKMCYAAYTKGTSALLCAILATAEELGVRQELEMQWSRNGSDFADQARQRVRRVTAKAWRFSGEMEEISATFEGAGLPAGFHSASAEIYRRLSHFKGTEMPALDVVLESLIDLTGKKKRT